MADSFADAKLCYEKAVHLGKKEGGSPEVLDEILKEKCFNTLPEINLGVISIPLDLVVGTKSRTRSSSFSKSFYPVLGIDTEFATKWIELCKAQLDEGIHDPIKAYEFMNRYYVEEGNKRVSVLKYFDAVSLRAEVTRLLPPCTNDKEMRIYYEFLDFYALSHINSIWFSKTGSFSRLQRLVGKGPNEPWSEEEQKEFESVWFRFLKEYNLVIRDPSGKNASVKDEKRTARAGDAFLYLIDLYGYDEVLKYKVTDFREKIKKLQTEFLLNQSEQSVSLHMNPDDYKKGRNHLFNLLPTGVKTVRAAFIHARNAHVSAWTNAHELGRYHLEDAFPGQVVTCCYDSATEENISQLLNKAVEDGNKLIFTTSPVFLKGSLKAAIDHPEVKILNCSLNTSHKHIRTYYARIYEAKFLMGIIAGCMCENRRIGYIADYPIYGSIAGINAFARGVQMVNPETEVVLEWSKMSMPLSETVFSDRDISLICGKDMARPGVADRKFGLYRIDDGSIWNMAMPVWDWGKFYEDMIRSIIDGNWGTDDEKQPDKGINYWWGMSSGMTDVIWSQRLPVGTVRLVELLKEVICSGSFNPFSGIMYSQSGVIREHSSDFLMPEEIIKMDWLADNVVGSIPSKEELDEPARNLATIQSFREEDHLP